MVQLDIPAAFAVSQLALDIARPAVKADAAEAREGEYPAIYWRLLARSILFAALVIAPAGVYLLCGWPGWEQIYWVEFVEHIIFHVDNALSSPAFIVAIVGAGYVGHRVGYWLLTSGRDGWLRPMYIASLVIPCLVVLACYPSFTLVGTYQQYHHNREAMELAWNNPHGFAIGWVGVIVYFVVTLLIFVKMTWRERRHVPGQ